MDSVVVEVAVEAPQEVEEVVASEEAEEVASEEAEVLQEEEEEATDSLSLSTNVID